MRNLFFSLSLCTSLSAENFGGWNWYKHQTPVTPPQKSAATKQSVSSASVQEEVSPKARFEAALKRAVDNPTSENVKAAYYAHAQMLTHASTFADKWMQVGLQEGGHVLNPADNAHPFHRKVKEQEEEKELAASLQALSTTHGLFLLAKKGCPYCTEFVPIIEAFAREYGFEVLVVGDVDAKAYPFKVLPDNGVIKALNTQEIYPALFLVNTSTHGVYPLSWGLSAPSDLKRNARIVLDHMASEKEARE